MMLLLRRVLVVCFGFALLLVLVRLAGTLNAPTIAAAQLRALDCEPRPCWHDIRPGVTTLKQILQIVQVDTGNPAYVVDKVVPCWRVLLDSRLNVCAFAPPNDTLQALS